MSAFPRQIPAVELAVRTDPGRDPDKQVNEDSYVEKETPQGLLAVVCDGMGGHAGGREASQLAIQTIVEVVEAAPAATPPGAALKRAIEEANARIWGMPTAEAGLKAGSTVVAVLAHEGGAEVAHVGDSRLYLVHAGAISQVTRDHSMVQEMVDRNLIRAEDAAKHPDANKILRALGIAKDVEVDLRPEPLAYVTGDILLLCSDGLSDLVEPGEILQIAGSHPPAQAAGQLVDLANARGGHDNITAMVVRMKASATPRDAATLVKTIPLTAHAPPEQGVPKTEVWGPGGTAVSPPLTQHTPPGAQPAGPPPAHGSVPTLVQAPAHATPPHAPSTPHPGHHIPRASAGSLPPPKQTHTLVIGILLAVIGVSIVVVGAVVFLRPEHRAVKVVDDRRPDAAVPPPEPEAGVEAPISPAPPLSVEPSAKQIGHLHRDGGVKTDGGLVDPCSAARRARESKASGAILEKLDEKCRASGGTP